MSAFELKQELSTVRQPGGMGDGTTDCTLLHTFLYRHTHTHGSNLTVLAKKSSQYKDNCGVLELKSRPIKKEKLF